MATSEYIPEKRSVATVAPIGRGKSRLQASMLAPLPMVINDLVAIVLAFGAALVLRSIVLDKVVRFSGIRHSMEATPLNVLYLGWFALVYVLIARRYGLYGHILKSAGGAHELRLTAQACLNAGMLLCGAVYMMHNLVISRALVVLLTFSAMVSVCFRRAVWRKRRYKLYARGVSTRHLVIVGTNHAGYELGRQIRNESRFGYTLRGYIRASDSEMFSDVPALDVLGGMGELRQIARKYFIDEVVITESLPLERVIPLLKQAGELGIDVRSISGYHTELTTNPGIEYLGAFPLVSLHSRTPRVISLAFKRAGDIVLSLLALIALSPAMLAIAIAIRLESRGSVFYTSERIGKRGLVFPCFKFRTMVVNADQLRKNLDSLNERDGVLFKVKNDPRVTRLGKFLRKYSLDELPQFFNVLRGEMSLVGPRPPVASEVEKYKLEHLRRLEVLPGLTGLWQVQARQDASFEKYIALDTAYVENWGFWLDLKILFRTAEVVLRGTGV